MKPIRIIFLVIAVLSPIGVCLSLAPQESASKYDDGLQNVIEFRDKIKHIHPFLGKVFPIAIVDENHFLVFDVDTSAKKYVFVMKAPTPMPIPPGVRAAFPLDFYNTKAACVVSGEIFNNPEDYVTIFHEFIHCYQWETCESRLRENLGVARKALRRNDYAWELNYPFPYSDSLFNATYCQFLQAMEINDPVAVYKYRLQLKRFLSQDDFEYLAWQEWKEGFARYIENQIRCRLNFAENHYGAEQPFHRISFYEGGARYIEFLIRQNPELATDIETLFYTIFNGKS